MAATKGLIDAAEVTRNPHVLAFALLAYGFAFRDADPDRAREALHRGLAIARDSGNRDTETHLAASVARLEANGSPRSNTPLWPSATTTTWATPRICVPRWLCSQYFSIGSHAMNRRPPSRIRGRSLHRIVES